MSSLHFCKCPENTRYTLSKQALGLWPNGTSLISSMEFPLHFPPNSAGWPQRHRFFSLPAQKLSAAKIKNKTNPSKVRPSWQTQRLQPHCSCFMLQSSPCSAATSCTPVPSSAGPESQLQAMARHKLMQPSRGAGWRENANYPDATGTLQDLNEPEPEAGTGFKVNQNTRLNSQLSP